MRRGQKLLAGLMHYSYDACYTEFTKQQGQRMATQWLA